MRSFSMRLLAQNNNKKKIRKDSQHVLRVKNELKSLKPATVNLPVDTKVCFNNSLYPCYKKYSEHSEEKIHPLVAQFELNSP